MANILSAAEGSNVLRCAVDDAEMLALLPLVDQYIEDATGRDWTADASVYSQAKMAARILLVRMHEDPGCMAAGSALGFGLRAALTQLEALALELESDGVPDESLKLVSTNIAGDMAIDASFVIIFNHEMAAGAVNQVSLEDASGNTIATTNSLDATGKILTVNPDADLTAASSYNLVIDDAQDVYGQTIYDMIGITTA